MRMMKTDVSCYLNQKVKIEMKSGTFYTCTIKDITDTSVSIIDKYGNIATLSLDEISSVIKYVQNGGK